MRAAVGILAYPSDLEPYLDFLVGQGFTSYWELQTQRNASATEPDLIGSKDLTMTSGDTVNVTDGPLPSEPNAQTFGNADTEGMAYTTSTYDPDQTWTFAGWFRMATVPSIVALFAFADASSVDYMYLLHRDDRSGLTIQWGTGGSANFLDFGINIENDGAWHHIAITRVWDVPGNSVTFRTYVDGVLANTSAGTIAGAGNVTASGGWTLANRPALDLGYSGDVAHVAFAEGVALSAAQLLAHQAYI